MIARVCFEYSMTAPSCKLNLLKVLAFTKQACIVFFFCFFFVFRFFSVFGPGRDQFNWQQHCCWLAAVRVREKVLGGYRYKYMYRVHIDDDVLWSVDWICSGESRWCHS